jgi:hypothetical protein
MPCTSALQQIKSTSLDFFFFGGWRGAFFPFFRSEWVALYLPSRVGGRFTLKRFVFSTSVLLLNDILIRAFVTNFGEVYRMFRNEFCIKTYECSDVPCEVAVITFLSGSASPSLLKESISGFRSAQLRQMYQKLASESVSHRWRPELPHCVTRLGANASSE